MKNDQEETLLIEDHYRQEDIHQGFMTKEKHIEITKSEKVVVQPIKEREVDLITIKGKDPLHLIIAPREEKRKRIKREVKRGKEENIH